MLYIVEYCRLYS